MNAFDVAPGEAVGGRYAVRKLLGRSEHSATYHALAIRNRDVALKVIPASLNASPHRLASLQAAVAATNALPERLALHVLELGVDTKMGIPFLVSRSGLTQMGYDIAQKVGMTMIGRATGKHFLLFTGGERFCADG